MYRIRSAFTLIEIIMVIVIFGIVASIGADIIASMYENYLKTRAINRLQTQTELTLNAITKRLQYRIRPTVRAIDTDNSSGAGLNDTTSLITATADYETLEWIGISNESLNGFNGSGGWSGFVDLDSNDTNSTLNFISTPGSDLNITSEIIKALTYGELSMDGSGSTNKVPAIIFKSQPYFDVDHFYNGDLTLDVNRSTNTRFNIHGGDTVIYNTLNEIYEQYYLTHTAYTIKPVGTSDDFNLTLIYNYQPWAGESFITDNDVNATLATNVSTFRFIQIGDVIRLKLCLHDNNQSGDYDFSVCKEKVVY